MENMRDTNEPRNSSIIAETRDYLNSKRIEQTRRVPQRLKGIFNKISTGQKRTREAGLNKDCRISQGIEIEDLDG